METVSASRVLFDSDPRLPGTILELTFSVGALVLLTGPWFALLANPAGQGTVAVSSSSLEAGLQAVMYGVAGVLAVSQGAKSVRAIRSSYWIWGLFLAACCSVLWSVDPQQTLRALIGLLGSGLLALYLGVRWNAYQQLLIICTAASLLVVASVAIVILEPSLGIDVGIHAGQWRGVFLTKNTFGRVMALGAVGFLATMCYVPRAKLLGFIGFTATSLLVWFSDSRTSMSIVLCVAGIVLIAPLLRGGISLTWLSLAVLLVAIVPLLAVWFQRDSLLLDHTADDTLTGRTSLWLAVLLQIMKHPWLGFGLRAFWSGRTGEFAQVWNFVHWAPPHSHNGFLDVALDLGVVGVLVFVGACIQGLWRAAQLLQSSHDPLQRTWTLLLISFFLLGNLTESTVLRGNAYWVLFMMAAIQASQSHAAWVGSRSPSRVSGIHELVNP